MKLETKMGLGKRLKQALREKFMGRRTVHTCKSNKATSKKGTFSVRIGIQRV